MPSAGLPCTSSAILCFFAGFSSSVASVLVGRECAVVKASAFDSCVWPRCGLDALTRSSRGRSGCFAPAISAAERARAEHRQDNKIEVEPKS